MNVFLLNNVFFRRIRHRLSHVLCSKLQKNYSVYGNLSIIGKAACESITSKE
jgi:hypothetical protein